MSDRTMIVLDAGVRRFQMRACALIRSDGHILIHRAVPDTIWALPGGRVEHGEAAADADLEFRWVRDTAAELAAWNLRPVLLRDMLAGTSDVVEHRVHRDASLGEPP